MLQLNLLRPEEGEVIPVGRYPFRIGRAADDQLRIEAPGVWERHCTLDWRGPDGIHLVGAPNSITSVNGKPVREIRVRNGDLVDLGGARFMLSVRPAAQRDFRLMEIFIWSTLAVVGMAQLFLMLRGLP